MIEEFRTISFDPKNNKSIKFYLGDSYNSIWPSTARNE